VYVFTPPNANVPPLTFTNEPVPLPPFSITPPNVPSLNVNAVPSNVTRPLEAPSNVSNVTAEAANSTVPLAVTTAPTGTNAPLATLSVAPLATLTEVDANRATPLNTNVPAFTLVAPVYVFTPPNVNVPPLTFTNEPATDPSTITPPNNPSPTVNAVPSNVTEPVDPPFNVNNSNATALSNTVPLAVNTVSVGKAPDTTAPFATLNIVDANRPVPLNASVPAFTAVAPVNVFTPPNVNVPPLAFTNEPATAPSAITPPNVPSLNVNAVPSKLTNPVDAPSNVNNVTADADNANVPSAVTAAPVAKAAPASTVNVAPAPIPTTVDANRATPLNANVPAFTPVAPVNVFTPLNVTTSDVSFTNAPTPLKTDVTLPFFTKNDPAPNDPPEINPSSNVTAVTACDVTPNDNSPPRTVTDVPAASAELTPSASVPASTTVAPVYVFTPLKVTRSEVVFVNPPAPASTEVTLPFDTP
jgi:hypothetical protein